MIRKIIGNTVGTTMNPQKIAEKIDAGTFLPKVTEQDDGKVLKVEGGQWSAGEDDATPLSNFDIETLLTNFK